jgi:hypothetical protein
MLKIKYSTAVQNLNAIVCILVYTKITNLKVFEFCIVQSEI